MKGVGRLQREGMKSSGRACGARPFRVPIKAAVAARKEDVS
jgi:hypothetical protein